MDATQRFSSRAEYYDKYRPGYPSEVIAFLQEATRLTPAYRVADVGSGTGRLTGMFLHSGNTVYAVEPNAEMRKIAEATFADNPGFVSQAGSAEDTGLAAASVDLITVAQAFHWFDVERARSEFQRILTPGGYVALIWNTRNSNGTPFLHDYDHLLQRYGVNHQQVGHRQRDPDRFARFFGPGGYQRVAFPNDQKLDRGALAGRLLSSSYAPLPDHPNHAPMMAALDELFRRYEAVGHVSLKYSTEVYWGRLT